MEIKDVIRQKRIAKGYSTTELAKLVGVSQPTIVRWESGYIATMKQSKILALSKALDIPVADIIGAGNRKDDEQLLLEAFRALDPEQKKQALQFLQFLNKTK